MAIMVVPVCKLSWFARATCATIAHAALWARRTDEAMNDGPVHAGRRVRAPVWRGKDAGEIMQYATEYRA